MSICYNKKKYLKYFLNLKIFGIYKIKPYFQNYCTSSNKNGKKKNLYSLPNDIIHQTTAATKEKSFEKKTIMTPL